VLGVCPSFLDRFHLRTLADARRFVRLGFWQGERHADVRPYCLIELLPEWEFDREAEVVFRNGGSVGLYVTDNARFDLQRDTWDWSNFIGSLGVEICQAQSAVDGCRIQGLSILYCRRTDPDTDGTAAPEGEGSGEQEAFWESRLRVDFGL
jgi:hypothetical protein